LTELSDVQSGIETQDQDRISRRNYPAIIRH
jgi:hypothetical protein